MKHIKSFDKHNEAFGFLSGLALGAGAAAAIKAGRDWYNKNQAKKESNLLNQQVNDELKKFAISVKQTSKSNIDFYHNGRLIAFIRREPTTAHKVLYKIRVLVYKDELVTDASDYPDIQSQKLPDDVEAIIINKRPRPIGITDPKKSYSQNDLATSLVMWWRKWSLSGLAVDEQM
jgi:hypothetical protein